MRYKVNFTFGGCVIIDAFSEDRAQALVENMSDAELMNHVDLEIQSVEEVTE